MRCRLPDSKPCRRSEAPERRVQAKTLLIILSPLPASTVLARQRAPACKRMMELVNNSALDMSCCPQVGRAGFPLRPTRLEIDESNIHTGSELLARFGTVAEQAKLESLGNHVTTFNYVPSSDEVRVQAQLQASQNWGSSRFSQQELVETLETHPPHSFYHGEGIPKVSNHPSMEIQSHDIVAAQSIPIVNRVMSGKQDAEDADERQMRMEAPAVDDAYNQSLQVPTWLSNAGTIMVQAGVSCAVPGTAVEGHGIKSGDVEDVSCHAGTDPKWCPVCAANGSSQCLCGMSMHADDAAISAPASYSNQSYAHNWSTIQSMMNNMHRPADPQHREDEHLVTSRDCLWRSASHTPPGMVQTETHHSAAHDQQGAVSQQQFVDLRHYPYNLNQDDAFGGQGTNGDQGAVPVEAAWEVARQKEEWEIARYKAMIVAHPLYLQLLELHAGCLRMGTPVDQLRNIDMQMERYMDVTNKYAVLQLDLGPEEQAELNEFMAQYVVVITAFKDHLQQHVYTDITEAMMSCWELEQALSNFTGQVYPLESTGATMSDSESDCDVDGSDDGYEPLSMDQQLETSAAGMYNPLVPSETDRSLMERVRQDLKQELQEGYRAKIEDVREEIMRKRRAGKLPDGTTTVLKAWWNAHSKWPYPTEDEKEKLIQDTGLELKQVNNWFINQRKRNWHSNPLAASSSSGVIMQKSTKRKSW